jgi:hypothetical protein
MLTICDLRFDQTGNFRPHDLGLPKIRSYKIFENSIPSAVKMVQVNDTQYNLGGVYYTSDNYVYAVWKNRIVTYYELVP